MFDGSQVVCVIPARGGSRGLPGKNIKDLLGKPLIVHSIEQGKRSKYVDRVIVSTEDNRIAAIARAHGAELPFIRPLDLATDTSSTLDVLLHALEWMKTQEKYSPEILVLLHATAPLRTVDDIDHCIALLFEKNVDVVFSVCEANRNPYFNMVEVDRRGRVRLVKKSVAVTRQSSPKVYDMNASIYVWRVAALLKEKKVVLGKSAIFVMPKERSVDIDDLMDFDVAKLMMIKSSA